MSYEQHHVWYLVPAWGHLTAGNALINRMLQLNPSLLVTIVTHASIQDRLEADYEQYPDLPGSRLRLVYAGKKIPDPPSTEKPVNPMLVMVQELHTTFLSTLASICTPGSPVPHPTALIFDVFQGTVILAQAKEIAGPNVKTLMHITQGASSLYGFYAPFSNSGWCDFEDAVEKIYSDEKPRKGRERNEIWEAVALAKNGTDKVNGTVISVPGVKEMYDYEREGYNIPLMPGMIPHMAGIVKLARDTDAAIVSSSYAIEGGALEAWSEFKKPYPVGVQVAPFGWEKGHKIEDATIRSFLDKHGKNEVLYISFGSTFFPVSTPHYITSLLSVLQSLEFPFIFALGGMMAKNGLPSETIESINSSGTGLIVTSWVDQRGILQHPSTGWFLTHAGWNSCSEALVQGKPMICWPISHGDQFMDAAMLSTRDEPLAFELLQVRMGDGRGPPRRGGGEISAKLEDVEDEFRDVLEKAKGKEGEVVRRNVEEMARRLREERDGRADEAVRELAQI